MRGDFRSSQSAGCGESCGDGGEGYEKDALSFPARSVGVFLPERNEFFREALGFFGFVPGGADGFVFEEGGDEVAEEGLAVGGTAVEVAVFEGAAGHGLDVVEGWGKREKLKGMVVVLAHMWEKE